MQSQHSTGSDVQNSEFSNSKCRRPLPARLAGTKDWGAEPVTKQVYRPLLACPAGEAVLSLKPGKLVHLPDKPAGVQFTYRQMQAIQTCSPAGRASRGPTLRSPAAL